MEDLVPVARDELVTLGDRDISRDHLRNELLKGDLGRPTEFGARLGGIPERSLHLRRPEVARIYAHDHPARAQIHAGFIEPGAAPLNLHAQTTDSLCDELEI